MSFQYFVDFKFTLFSHRKWQVLSRWRIITEKNFSVSSWVIGTASVSMKWLSCSTTSVSTETNEGWDDVVSPIRMFVNHVVRLYIDDTEHNYLAPQRYNKAKARTFPGVDISSDQDMVLVLYLHRIEPLTPCALFVITPWCINVHLMFDLVVHLPHGVPLHTWCNVCLFQFWRVWRMGFTSTLSLSWPGSNITEKVDRFAAFFPVVERKYR